MRDHAYHAETPTSTVLAARTTLGLDEQIEGKAKRWLRLPWIGLLTLPLVVIGLAFVLTTAIAVAMPQHEDRPWLGWDFGVAALVSPVAGIIWLWVRLKRRKSLVAQRRARLDSSALS